MKPGVSRMDRGACMMQVTRSEVVVSSRDAIASLRDQFTRQHYVILPKFIEKNLLDYALQRLQTASFYTHIHGGEGEAEVAREQSVSGDEPIARAFFLLLNRPDLFQMVQQITECPPIASFTGRFYVIEPNSDYHMDWHTDLGTGYLVGLSIHLTTEAYEGGVFQLRERSTQQILYEVGNVGFGSAHLFRLAKFLEHRVTPTVGNIPRMVYTGWFRAKPHYRDSMRCMLQRQKQG